MQLITMKLKMKSDLIKLNLSFNWMLILVLFSIINLENIQAQSFEKYHDKINEFTSLENLNKQKKKDDFLYKKTKDKYHLYNSKYICFLVDLKNNKDNYALSHLNFIINDSKLKNTLQYTWINYYMAQTLTEIDAEKVAEEYIYRALNLAKKYNFKGILENSYSTLAYNNFKQKKYQIAVELYKKAYYYSIKNNQTRFFILSTINDIGVCYRKMKKNKEALFYYDKAAYLINKWPNKTEHDQMLLLLIDANKGIIYADLNDYKRAIPCLENEINYYYKHPQFLDIGAARTLIGLIEIYEKTKNNVLVKQRIIDLKKLEKRNKDDELTLLIDHFLYNFYLRNNEQAKAIEITNKLIGETDKSKNKAIAKMSVFNNLVYIERIKLLKSISKTNSELINTAVYERKISQKISVIVTIFLVFVFVLAFFFYRSMKRNIAKNVIIEKQSLQIFESINYSKKIQDSLLPDLENMKKSVHDLFVFYQPKDIVSGDFYWYKSFQNYSVFACVDCTGHGVPGGFMSTIGSLAIDKISNSNFTDPSEMLSALNTEIIRILHQKNDNNIQDGMDLSICIIDHSKNQLSFGGARNGIIIIKEGIAQRYKADLLPVGGNYLKKGKSIERVFTTQTIDISKNDWIYMSTDGFVEQIGGDKNLPMNYLQYENLLTHLSNQENDAQRNKFMNSELNNWMGNNERTDDILVIGFQLRSS